MSKPIRAVSAVSATALFSTLLISGPAAAETDAYKELPDGTQTNKTLVVGIDGASFDFLDQADMPNLDALRAGGVTAVSNLFAEPMAPTVSGPAWSSIATGAWPDKHKAVNNNFTDTRYDQYPDYLTRLEADDPARSSLVVATWGPIATTIFGEAVDLRLTNQGGDAGTTATTVDYLTHGNPDNVFVHLDEVDGIGHHYGTNEPEYIDSLTKADEYLGQMIAAIEARETYDAENWTIVVVSDHGHTPLGGHGGSTPAERQVFVVAAGPGIEAGTVRHDVKIVDIAPTVLKANGVLTDPEWDIDGAALDDLVPDDFDSLRPVLQKGVDERRPGDALGWTHETPEGWTIDNSNMPDGGVTEWRGWSFATDEFWTNTDLEQKREGNVRARNVFAVADSDEFDDLPNGGSFDSTLISPAYSVSGGRTGVLSFASNYQEDGPQTGEVLVSFDGGVPVSLKKYTENTNTVEHLSFAIPADATTAQFRFHYTGSNSYFWTVDQVQLSETDAPSVHPIVITGGSASVTEAVAGDVITITADVPDGHTFSGWTVSDGVVLDDPTSAETSFVMPDDSVTITAITTEVEAPAPDESDPIRSWVKQFVSNIVKTVKSILGALFGWR